MFFKLLTFFAVFFGGILSSWLVFTYLPFLGIIVLGIFWPVSSGVIFPAVLSWETAGPVGNNSFTTLRYRNY